MATNNKWDERYSEAGFAFGIEVNDFLREEYQRIPAGGKVLCLAEGEGRNAVFLAQKGYLVTGIDSSRVGLDKARRLADDKGVTIGTQVVDIADYDFGSQQWDAIVSVWLHMSSALRQHVHAQIASALKPDGLFIAEAYTEQQLAMDAIGGPPASEKDRFGSLENFQQELPDLEEIVGVEKLRMVAEGTRHRGVSAVVQYTGRKL